MSKTLLLSMVFVATSPAMGADGQIKFNGAILDTTCTINSSPDTTLKLSACRETIAKKVKFERTLHHSRSPLRNTESQTIQNTEANAPYERITVTYF